MDLNNIKSQLKNLQEYSNNKKILIFGPGNKYSKDDILKEFKKYDIIIIFGPTLQLLLNLNIDISKYKLILLCSGWFVEVHKDMIVKNAHNIFYYFGSEIHTMRVLENYGINTEKIIHMANNYKIYGFTGCPTMGPKILLFLFHYKFDFRKIKIMGLTFQMDFNNKDSIYDLGYKDITFGILFKDLSNSFKDTNLPEEDYEQFKKYKSYLDLPDDLKKKIINSRIIAGSTGVHKGIYEGWNMFLRFLYHYKDRKIILDNKLNELLKKYPNIMKDEIKY